MDETELAALLLPILKRVAPDEQWKSEAACQGLPTAMFYSETPAGQRESKQVCARCTVRVECDSYATANGEKVGTWGGKTEVERRRRPNGRYATPR